MSDSRRAAGGAIRGGARRRSRSRADLPVVRLGRRFRMGGAGVCAIADGIQSWAKARAASERGNRSLPASRGGFWRAGRRRPLSLIQSERCELARAGGRRPPAPGARRLHPADARPADKRGSRRRADRILITFTAENPPGDRSMTLTTSFVVYCMFRRIYLVHARDAGETPERVILTDAPTLASIALWLLASGAIPSFGR